MGRRALRISVATMLSRVFGLVREVILTSLFGSGAFAEAFRVAFRIPNLARDLFAEGALSSAFVPTFTDALTNQDRERAFRLANVVVGAVLVIVGSVAAIGIVAAPWVVDLLTAFDGETRSLAITGTRILFPFLPIVSLAAVAMGQLNAQERYTAPSLAPVTFNLIAIACGVVLLVSDVPPETAFLAWAGATLLGGLGQLLVQVPPLWKTGYRPRPAVEWSHPGLRRIGRLMAPAVIGLAATNVNVMVNTFFATQEQGAVTWLEVAFRMVYLPIGVFAVAIATVATTRLAMRAAEGDHDGMRQTLTEGLRLVAFLTVPSTIGLIVLREPIVRMVYEYGEFNARDTVNAAAALAMYALGLAAYASVKVAAPAFYALERPRVPLAASVSAVAVNVVVAVTLFPVLGFPGLALGTALGAFVNIGVLLKSFSRIVGGLPVATLLSHLLRVLLASAASGAGAWMVWSWLETALGTAEAQARVGAVVPAVLAGMLTYLLVAAVLGLREVRDLLAFVRR